MDQRRQTYHHRHTCGETMGDKKGRQDVGKADAPSNIGTRVGRQDLLAEVFFSDSAEQGLGHQYNLAKMEKSAKVLGVQFGVVKSDAERAMVVQCRGSFRTSAREGEHTIQKMQAHM